MDALVSPIATQLMVQQVLSGSVAGQPILAQQMFPQSRLMAGALQQRLSATSLQNGVQRAPPGLAGQAGQVRQAGRVPQAAFSNDMDELMRDIVDAYEERVLKSTNGAAKAGAAAVSRRQLAEALRRRGLQSFHAFADANRAALTHQALSQMHTLLEGHDKAAGSTPPSNMPALVIPPPEEDARPLEQSSPASAGAAPAAASSTLQPGNGGDIARASSRSDAVASPAPSRAGMRKAKEMQRLGLSYERIQRERSARRRKRRRGISSFAARARERGTQPLEALPDAVRRENKEYRERCFAERGAPVAGLQLPAYVDVTLVPDILAMSCQLRTLSRPLRLAPFSSVALVIGLHLQSPCMLIEEVCVSILRQLSFIAKDLRKAVDIQRGALNWKHLDFITWPCFAEDFISMKLTEERKSLNLAGEDTVNGKDEGALLQRISLDPLLQRAYRSLSQADFCLWPTRLKVALLRFLLDEVIDTPQVLQHLEAKAVDENYCVLGDETADGSDDVCAICLSGGNLVCCETCPSVYHMRCVGETKASLPDDAWYCYECRSKDNARMGMRVEPRVYCASEKTPAWVVGQLGCKLRDDGMGFQLLTPGQLYTALKGSNAPRQPVEGSSDHITELCFPSKEKPDALDASEPAGDSQVQKGTVKVDRDSSWSRALPSGLARAKKEGARRSKDEEVGALVYGQGTDHINIRPEHNPTTYMNRYRNAKPVDNFVVVPEGCNFQKWYLHLSQRLSGEELAGPGLPASPLLKLSPLVTPVVSFMKNLEAKLHGLLRGPWQTRAGLEGSWLQELEASQARGDLSAIAHLLSALVMHADERIFRPEWHFPAGVNSAVWLKRAHILRYRHVHSALCAPAQVALPPHLRGGSEAPAGAYNQGWLPARLCPLPDASCPFGDEPPSKRRSRDRSGDQRGEGPLLKKLRSESPVAPERAPLSGRSGPDPVCDQERLTRSGLLQSSREAVAQGVAGPAGDATADLAEALLRLSDTPGKTVPTEKGGSESAALAKEDPKELGDAAKAGPTTPTERVGQRSRGRGRPAGSAKGKGRGKGKGKGKGKGRAKGTPVSSGPSEAEDAEQVSQRPSRRSARKARSKLQQLATEGDAEAVPTAEAAGRYEDGDADEFDEALSSLADSPAGISGVADVALDPRTRLRSGGKRCTPIQLQYAISKAMTRALSRQGGTRKHPGMRYLRARNLAIAGYKYGWKARCQRATTAAHIGLAVRQVSDFLRNDALRRRPAASGGGGKNSYQVVDMRRCAPGAPTRGNEYKLLWQVPPASQLEGGPAAPAGDDVAGLPAVLATTETEWVHEDAVDFQAAHDFHRARWEGRSKEACRIASERRKKEMEECFAREAHARQVENALTARQSRLDKDARRALRSHRDRVTRRMVNDRLRPVQRVVLEGKLSYLDARIRLGRARLEEAKRTAGLKKKSLDEITLEERRQAAEISRFQQSYVELSAINPLAAGARMRDPQYMRFTQESAVRREATLRHVKVAQAANSEANATVAEVSSALQQQVGEHRRLRKALDEAAAEPADLAVVIRALRLECCQALYRNARDMQRLAREVAAAGGAGSARLPEADWRLDANGLHGRVQQLIAHEETGARERVGTLLDGERQRLAQDLAESAARRAFEQECQSLYHTLVEQQGGARRAAKEQAAQRERAKELAAAARRAAAAKREQAAAAKKAKAEERQERQKRKAEEKALAAAKRESKKLASQEERRQRELAKERAKEEKARLRAAALQAQRDREARGVQCVCEERVATSASATSRPMIRCDHCKGWFHCACCGVSEHIAGVYRRWACPACCAGGATIVGGRLGGPLPADALARVDTAWLRERPPGPGFVPQTGDTVMYVTEAHRAFAASGLVDPRKATRPRQMRPPWQRRGRRGAAAGSEPAEPPPGPVPDQLECTVTGVEYEFPSEGQLGDDSTRQMFCVVTLTPQREFFRGGDGLDQAASRVEALAPFQVLYKVHEGPPFLLLMHEVEGALWREGDACIVPASVVRRKGIPGGNGDGLAGVVTRAGYFRGSAVPMYDGIEVRLADGAGDVVMSAWEARQPGADAVAMRCPSLGARARARLFRALMQALDAAEAFDFLDPVSDSVAPGYSLVIPRPACLNDVADRLALDGYYRTEQGPLGDLQMILSNCVEYNGAQAEITAACASVVKRVSAALEESIAKSAAPGRSVALTALSIGERSAPPEPVLAAPPQKAKARPRKEKDPAGPRGEGRRRSPHAAAGPTPLARAGVVVSMKRSKGTVVRIAGRCLDLLYGSARAHRTGRLRDEAGVALDLKVHGPGESRIRVRITDKSPSRAVLRAAGGADEEVASIDELALQIFDDETLP